MHWATYFHANHSLDGPKDVRGSENAKSRTQKLKFIST